MLTALACLFGVATAFQPWAEVSMATFNKPPASAVGFAWWQGMVVAFSFTAMALLLLATVVAARFPRWRPVVVVVGALAVAAADASSLTEFSRGDLPVEPLLTAAKWGIEIDGKTPQTIREAKVVATRREGPYWVLSTAAAVLVLTAVESGLALWQANRRSPSRPGVLNRR
ncbi:MAG TPA: hypothetical protein VFI31_18395 [Pirellulales bacterium]|nr:hypothetical protein [Pirellulales bacterium]